ncbi:MAG: four-helix bundle copper-binding protein [Pyrinomonadaceae bacterium]
MSSHATGRVSDRLQECIEQCTNCQNICVATVQYCLEQGGKHAEASHIRKLLDCAEICQTSANFMLRGSELHLSICMVCAEACVRCAESCEQMRDDERMRACAEACRSCAETCERMATAA